MLYRSKPSGVEWVSALRQKIVGPKDHEKAPRFRRRNQIVLRVFRDVPLPTWKIVFPEKLLQFRPLDSARADIFSLAGTSHHAQYAIFTGLLKTGELEMY